MEPRSPKMSVEEAKARFSRLKRRTEPNWGSAELDVLISELGPRTLLDDVSPGRLAGFLFRLKMEDVRGYGGDYRTVGKREKYDALRIFFQFCYETGFIGLDLRPMVELDHRSLDRWSTRPVPLPGRIRYISAQGRNRLQRELDYLYTDQRPRLAAWLAVAAPDSGPGRPAFDIPKEVQSIVEGRIAELEFEIRTAVVIEKARERFLFPECVNIGDTVKLEDQLNDEVEEYTLVGSYEANPAKGWMSFYSPMGQALLGSLEGDKVNVVVPVGKRNIQVAKVERRPIRCDEPEHFVDYVRYP